MVELIKENWFFSQALKTKGRHLFLLIELTKLFVTY